jgi:hypothetical protein
VPFSHFGRFRPLGAAAARPERLVDASDEHQHRKIVLGHSAPPHTGGGASTARFPGECWQEAFNMTYVIALLRALRRHACAL